MQPGVSSMLQLRIINLETYGNELDFLSELMLIDISSRPCTLGESLTQDRKCIPCAPGTYSIAINITEPHDCKPCPNHAICLGGADMTPQRGFVRVDERSIIFMRCINEAACLLPDRQDWLGKCDSERGYEGYMCSECMDGFWRRENFHECYKCQSSSLSRFLWVMAVALFLLIIVWITLIFLRNLNKKQNVTIPLVRMFITYYHIYSILSGLEMF